MIVRRARVPDAARAPLPDGWPFRVPAVAHVVAHGLDFTHPVTFLVGENGSGKSTLLEAIAEAYGLDVRGGHGGRRYGPAEPGIKSPLGERLHLERTGIGSRMRGRRTKGFFLRAETAFGVFGAMSDYGVVGYGDAHLLEISHGESFLQVFQGRFDEVGLYLLDEPEAALSFTSCLALIALLNRIAADGGQVICATHSPILAATPGAQILELGAGGITTTAWKDLQLVDHWRRYLTDPEAYLRHLG